MRPQRLCRLAGSLILLFLQVLCAQRLQQQPQASLSSQDELGETLSAAGAGPKFRVHSWGQTKPEQGQRHDDSQLRQGEFLTDTVPVNTQVYFMMEVSGAVWLVERGRCAVLYLGPEEKGMKA